MGAAADMAATLEMVTEAPARILGRHDHGLAVGCRADLVVLDASTLAEAVGGLPARVLVLTAGRVTMSRGDGMDAGALDSGERRP
jgi:cytosine deaminase